MCATDLEHSARSSEGFIRKARNISISCLLKAVRDQIKIVDIKQVNQVLIQPHWRSHRDLGPIGLIPNQVA
jgi:hypothetical protein